MISLLGSSSHPGSRGSTTGATAAIAATSRGGKWRGCRRGRLAFGRPERPTVDEVGRARHHQTEISGRGTAPIAVVRVGVLGGWRTAPIRAGRQSHRVATNSDDRVIGADWTERQRFGDDAVGEECARHCGGTLICEPRRACGGDRDAIRRTYNPRRYEPVEPCRLAGG